VTKALICLACVDVVTPYRSGQRWRWCQCGQAAVRWRNPERGLIDVTTVGGPRMIRVLGLNNQFLEDAVTAGIRTPAAADHWQDLHQRHTTEVPHHYLFHAYRRGCWAVVIAVGETGDVQFVDPATVAGWPPDRPAPEETHTP
jgi:hypothetical protein